MKLATSGEVRKKPLTPFRHSNSILENKVNGLLGFRRHDKSTVAGQLAQQSAEHATGDREKHGARTKK